MSLSRDDIKCFKSLNVSDTDSNGGVMDETKEVINNVKYNLFPRVTYLERINGVVRYRKEFIVNRNANNEPAYGAIIAILKPSNGDDRFYIKQGTQTDTQADLSNEGWVAGGKLFEDVAAGATEIKLLFESTDVFIPNGGLFVIGEYTPLGTDLFQNVSYVRTKNENRDILLGYAQLNVTYYQFFIGSNDRPITPNTLKIIYTIGGTQYEAQDDGQGNIIGEHLTSATVDYEAGEINLHFDTSPDQGSELRAQYTRRCYTWSGNVAIIRLEDVLPFAYQASNDVYGGVGLELGDLIPSIENVSVNSPNGTFDDSKIEVFNVGTIYETWTITFISSTTFSVSGSRIGSLPNGTISLEYAPINSNVNAPYFKIPADTWGGVWDIGDSITFTTIPAAKAVWWKEVVPAGANREPNNVVIARVAVE
ncbi:hypothetical protein JCM12298_10490 [Desulfothermus naphthae]